MKRYDVVVVGAGDAGLRIAFKAAAAGQKVALIDKGKVGGTCINNGCVPSKTLLFTADRIMEVREAARLNVQVDIRNIDFAAIMGRMQKTVLDARNGIRSAIDEFKNMDFYNSECSFLDRRTLMAGDDKVTGRKIFIASGSRPFIPPISGLDAVDYLTNETVLDLDARPESIIIIGGGYIGLEYAHFFSAVGADVTVLEKGYTLLPFEEFEISELLKDELSGRMRLMLGKQITAVRKADRRYAVHAKDLSGGGEVKIAGDRLLLATGRRSNADLLDVNKAGIATDAEGYVRVDPHLRTGVSYIWAAGDAVGRAMFTHAGDKMADIAWHNATSRKKIAMNFDAVPHVVFTAPQIASIGLTEELARKNHEVLIGRARYSDTVMGEAMMESRGFAKAIVEKSSKRILGFHVIGPHASLLIQEVVNALTNGTGVASVTGCMHAFPALTDLVTEVFDNLE